MNIVQEVNECEFVDSFRRYNRYDDFGRSALVALFDYLEQICEDTGEPYELDVIALCCDWGTYGSAKEAAKEYGYEGNDEEDDEEDAVQWLSERTTVIAYRGGVLVQSF